MAAPGSQIEARPEPWETEGSFVIERYVYEGPKGGTGVQWIVHRVKNGELVHLHACDTLSKALEVAGANSCWFRKVQRA